MGQSSEGQAFSRVQKILIVISTQYVRKPNFYDEGARLLLYE